MAIAITAEERSAWLAAAISAGLSAKDDRDSLVAKSATLGIDAHWMIPRGFDIHGRCHERYIAYVVVDGFAEEMIGADTVEEALRMAIGESLVKRTWAEPPLANL